MTKGCQLVRFTCPCLIVMAVSVGARPGVGDDAPGEARMGERWRLRELWSLNLSSQELIVGSIDEVDELPDGTLLCLDTQLSVVHLFEEDGDYIRSIGRDGDGPGETRSPIDVTVLGAGEIAVSQSFPGKILTLSVDGTPRGELVPVLREADEGGIISLRATRYRGGCFYVAGHMMGWGEGSTIVSECVIVRLGATGRVEQSYFAGEVQNDFMESHAFYDERSYYAELLSDLWDVDDRGRVYFAPDRSSYRIMVAEADGTAGRPIEKRQMACLRSSALVAKLEAVHRERFRSLPFSVKVHVDPADQAIRHLVIRESELWVLPCTGVVQSGDSMSLEYDVYDLEGGGERTVSFALAGNIETDGVFLLSRDRVLAVANRGNPRTSGAMARIEAGGYPVSEDLRLTCFEAVGSEPSPR